MSKQCPKFSYSIHIELRRVTFIFLFRFTRRIIKIYIFYTVLRETHGGGEGGYNKNIPDIIT